MAARWDPGFWFCASHAGIATGCFQLRPFNTLFKTIMAHLNQPRQQYPSGSRSPAPQYQQQQSASSTNSSSAKPADYVYFDRSTAGFSEEAVPKAKGAQLKLEHFYKVAVDSAIERNQRYVCLILVFVYVEVIDGVVTQTRRA